jgi:glucose-6-phosphate isomerase
MEENMRKMQLKIDEQQQQLFALQTTIEHQQKEIDILNNPNYDQLFSYFDRQIQHLNEDMERKLQVKADKREVETVIPQRLEDVYRNLHTKYHDLKTEVTRLATKEELSLVIQSKVKTI